MPMSVKRERVMASVVFVGLCMVGNAWAGDDADPSGQPAKQGSTKDKRGEPATSLEEIVVYAQKRYELVQDVPIAISAFSQKDYDKLSLVTGQDFANFTPSMTYTTDNRVFLRGIGQTTGQGGVEPGVGTYVDGVYNTSPLPITTPAILIDHAEVLRGPQGTLYGRNTQGGAINIVEKRPTSDFEAEFRQSFGDYQTSRSGLTLSGPVNDWLRYRVSGTFDYQGQGYTENLAAKYHLGSTSSMELQLEADATDRLKLWLKLNYAHIYQHQDPAYYPVPYDTTTPSFNGGITVNPLFGYTGTNPALTNPRRVAQNTIPLIEANTPQAELTADWNLGAVLLRYIGGYSYTTAHITADLDDSPATQPFTYVDAPGSVNPALPFSLCGLIGGCLISPVDVADIYTRPWNYSNEIDLISQGDTRLKWLFGLYQYHEYSNFNSNLHRPFETALTSLPNNPTGTYIDAIEGNSINSFAEFAQADYALTDRFSLQAGIRNTYDKKDAHAGLPVLNFSGPLGLLQSGFTSQGFAIPGGQGATAYYGRSWDGVTARLAVQWRPDSTTNAYALIATGYKAGAITDPTLQVRVPGGNPEPQVLPAEKLYDYELGLKKDISKTLRTDVAAFYYDYHNMQVQTTGPDPVIHGNFVPTFVSAPKSRVAGFEAQILWQPTQNIDASLNYSYLDATIRQLSNVVDLSLPPPRSLQSVAGNQIPFTTRQQGAVNAGYTWLFAPGSFRFGATYAYVGPHFDDIFSTPTYLVHSYEEVDLNALWRSANERVTVIGYAKNLTDKLGASVLTLTNGTAQTNYTLLPPRTFGVEVQLKWF